MKIKLIWISRLLLKLFFIFLIAFLLFLSCDNSYFTLYRDWRKCFPVEFSPKSGTYENIVEVQLSSQTADANIYYTNLLSLWIIRMHQPMKPPIPSMPLLFVMGMGHQTLSPDHSQLPDRLLCQDLINLLAFNTIPLQ